MLTHATSTHHWHTSAISMQIDANSLPLVSYNDLKLAIHFRTGVETCRNMSKRTKPRQDEADEVMMKLVPWQEV